MAKAYRRSHSDTKALTIFIASYIPAFVVYHLCLCWLFPVDENNYIIAPDWYIPLGFLVAFLISLTAAIITRIYMIRKQNSVTQQNIPYPEPVTVTSPIDSHVPAHIHGAPEPLPFRFKIEDIDSMEGHEFEYWCADLLRNNGFTNVQVTRGSGDQGVDILAEKDGVKYAIQCKNYSTDLGNKPVQEVNTGKVIYCCHIAAVMTNRYFTYGGKEAAAATGVLLWDRDWIKQHLPQDLETTVTSAPPQATSYSSQRDELFSFAVEIVLSMRQASISILQRRLDVGYARAARIIDQMEDAGIIGPFKGSKPRDILITLDQWYDGTYRK